MPELVATLKAVYESERRRQKFMAALQGVDLNDQAEEEVEEAVSSIEDIKARAVARLTGDKNMAGAVSQGFTPEMGVIYEIAEGTELG